MHIGVGVKFKRAPRSRQSFATVYEECIVYARAADALGFDYLVVPEHHSSEIGYDPAPFVTLAALARETRRIRLATQPLLLPLYHPVHVAEQLATLDVLSNGRAMLGVGVGYRERDFETFGVPRAERGARTEEALTLLLGVLRERNFSFKGRFYEASGVSLTPPPVQQPHPPLFITARSEPAVARAARFGLGVNTLWHEARDGGIYDMYCRHVEASAMDPRDASFTVVRNGFIGATRDDAIRVAGPYIQGRTDYMATPTYAGRDAVTPRTLHELRTSDGQTFRTEGELVGEPTEWIDAMRADLDALNGPVPFGGYTLGLWPEGMPLSDALSGLELFAREVLPWAHAQRQASA